MDCLEVADLLREQDHILILTHRRPDGDTIGCAAALCHGLRQLGKCAHILPNPEASDLFMPYLEGLLASENFVPRFIVTVDTAAIELFSDHAQHLRDRIDLSIDHHGSNSNYAKSSCVDPACAACGELVYLILKELGPISTQMAKLLYVAISTDTGCFSFSNTSANTHRIAADLIEIGCAHQWVNKLHFRTKSLTRFRLESILAQEMLLLEDGCTVLASITLKMVERFSATEEDLDNISSFLEQVKGVKNAVTLRELRSREYKISLRTGSELNASTVCALFGGGGHPSAAGCTINGSLEEVKAAIIRAISQVQSENS